MTGNHHPAALMTLPPSEKYKSVAKGVGITLAHTAGALVSLPAYFGYLSRKNPNTMLVGICTGIILDLAAGGFILNKKVADHTVYDGDRVSISQKYSMNDVGCMADRPSIPRLLFAITTNLPIYDSLNATRGDELTTAVVSAKDGDIPIKGTYRFNGGQTLDSISLSDAGSAEFKADGRESKGPDANRTYGALCERVLDIEKQIVALRKQQRL